MKDRTHLELPSSGEAYASKCAFQGVVHIEPGKAWTDPPQMQVTPYG